MVINVKSVASEPYYMSEQYGFGKGMRSTSGKRNVLPVKVRHNSTTGDYTSGVKAVLLAKV